MVLTSKMLDPKTLRQDFPILKRKVNGKPLVYLDNAASSQKPQQVLDAMHDYYTQHHANVHRGVHTLASEATDLYEEAREKVARFIHAPSAKSVVFTRNTTEALNLFAQSWGGANLQAGDEVILTLAEHHANLVPWHMVAERTGAVIQAVQLDDAYRLDLEHFESLLSEKTRVVAIAHMSNVLGGVHPIKQMAAKAHAHGALMVVDGAQAAPHLPVNVADLDADVYALSGHKLCGPTGAGALWVREEILYDMPPFLGGGDMIRKVEVTHSTYADIPMRFEAGTPNIAEAVGLGAALDYLSELGMEAVWAHDQALTRYALEQLKPLDGVTLYGPEGEDRGGIVTFTVEGAHPHDIATALDQEGIAIRAGHHCTQPLHHALGIQSSARASFYLYNTEEDVDTFVAALIKTRDFFSAFA